MLTSFYLVLLSLLLLYAFFFHISPAPSYIYTLSLHDALPICHQLAGELRARSRALPRGGAPGVHGRGGRVADRKSTRLNSSHLVISYAVFCLKKKKRKRHIHYK